MTHETTRLPTGVLDSIRVTQDVLRRLHMLHRRYLDGLRDGRRVMMNRCDLSGLDFQHLDFSQGHFVNCNFRGASLRQAGFRCASLFGALFDEADLSAADFARADLRGTSFADANLHKAHFGDADLRRGITMASPGHANSQSGGSSTFRGARLNGTNLTGTKLGSAVTGRSAPPHDGGS